MNQGSVGGLDHKVPITRKILLSVAEVWSEFGPVEVPTDATALIRFDSQFLGPDGGSPAPVVNRTGTLVIGPYTA